MGTIRPKFRLVLVKWLDHTGDSGWFDNKSLEKIEPVTATTIGWIVSEDKKTLKLADTLLNDDEFGGVTAIIKKTIIDRWDITWK